MVEAIILSQVILIPILGSIWYSIREERKRINQALKLQEKIILYLKVRGKR